MISDRFKKAILNALKLDNFDLEDATFAYQVPGWDSLNHVLILAEIEKAYCIRFKTAEVLRLKNLGDLQSLADRKTTVAGPEY